MRTAESAYLDIGPVPGVAHAPRRQPPGRLGPHLRKVQRRLAPVADDVARQHRQDLGPVEDGRPREAADAKLVAADLQWGNGMEA